MYKRRNIHVEKSQIKQSKTNRISITLNISIAFIYRQFPFFPTVRRLITFNASAGANKNFNS